MTKKKEPEKGEKTLREVYEEHNDESAQYGEPEKQCQCEDCKAYRSE